MHGNIFIIFLINFHYLIFDILSEQSRVTHMTSLHHVIVITHDTTLIIHHLSLSPFILPIVLNNPDPPGQPLLPEPYANDIIYDNNIATYRIILSSLTYQPLSLMTKNHTDACLSPYHNTVASHAYLSRIIIG